MSHLKHSLVISSYISTNLYICLFHELASPGRLSILDEQATFARQLDATAHETMPGLVRTLRCTTAGSGLAGVLGELVDLKSFLCSLDILVQVIPSSEGELQEGAVLSSANASFASHAD